MPVVVQAEADEVPVHPIDLQHERISRRVLGINRWLNRTLDRRLDAWQGEAENGAETPLSDEDLRGSHIEVAPWVLFREGGGHDIGVDYKVRLRLLPLSGRLDFFADRYDSQLDTIDTSESDRYRRAPDPGRNQPALAGLTYFLLRDVASQLDISGGLRFKPEPTPRLRLRGRYRHPVGEYWQATVEQSVYWDRIDGFGERSQLDFSRRLSERARARFTSSVVWSEQSRGLDVGHISSCLIAISRFSSVEMRAGALGYTHPAAVIDHYLVRTPIRRRFRRDWLVLQLEPGVDWFRERNYAPAWLMSVKLEMRFGSADAYGL